jgi:ATP-binding cassette subfamily F protein 3
MGSRMIRAKDLKLSYQDRVIIEGGNFLIKKGEKVGIIGANGSGKTSLLNCIAKIQEYSGQISIDKNATIGYQEQDKNFPENSNLLKEYEKVFSDVITMEKKLKELEANLKDEKEYEKYLEVLESYNNNENKIYKKLIRSVILGLGFEEKDLEKPFKYFSGGELVKAAIGKAIIKKPDILLLDEPSNHLDIDSIEWLERTVSSISSTVIIVSHDKYFLNRVVNKILEIEFKKIYQYDGNYNKYLELKENRMKSLEREQKNLIKEIKRNEEIIARLRSYGREKAIKQALSREKKVEKLKEKITVINKSQNIKVDVQPENRIAYKVLVVSNLSKSFDKLLFQNVSFEIHGREKIGLIGKNGSGKSTLLKMLIESSKDHKILKGYGIKIGYYDQKLEILNEDWTIFENLKVEVPDMDDSKVRKILGRYLFRGEDVFRKVKNTSGGEKARLALAKILIHKPNFLILDEPTNHLDIPSREIITHALKEFKGSILLVSHDRFLLDSVCNKIFLLTKNGIKTYLGNFSYYYNKKYSPEKIEKTKKEKAGKQIYEKNKLLKKMTANINKKETELKEIEDSIDKIESEIDELYSDPSNYIELEKKIKEKEKLESKYLEMLEVIEKLKNEYEGKI